MGDQSGDIYDMDNEKSHEVTLTSVGLKRMCRRSVIAVDSEWELQCGMEMIGVNTTQMSIPIRRL